MERSLKNFVLLCCTLIFFMSSINNLCAEGSPLKKSSSDLEDNYDSIRPDDGDEIETYDATSYDQCEQYCKDKNCKSFTYSGNDFKCKLSINKNIVKEILSKITRRALDGNSNNTNCINCVNCSNCVNSRNLRNCSNCSNCYDCNDCSNCTGCTNCNHCSNTTNCRNKNNCSNCTCN